MPCTLFIADLHLSEEEPAITAGFLAFLRQEALKADALYILGDLFEVWIGDDDPTPLHSQVADALSTLRQHHVDCYFIHGNRDFLLGKRFAAAAGIILLSEEQVVERYGRRLVIMHGDTLCTDDKAYQRFRHRVHQRWLQRLFLSLPLFIRQRVAARMRADSTQANRSKSLQIMDVNHQAVIEVMQRHRVHCLIHGHTHRPAVHPLTIEGKAAERLVLGAWHTTGSFIAVTPDGATLMPFTF